MQESLQSDAPSASPPARLTAQAARETVLPLIVQQLQAYGFPQIGQLLHKVARLEDYTLDPSNKLAELCVQIPQTYESEQTSEEPKAPFYLSGFTGNHKSAVSSAAFSFDGRFVATASHDGTLRVLDTDIMDDLLLSRASAKADTEDGPIILHDVAFHPINLVLASCSDDQIIRFYDVTRSSSRRSFRYIADSFPVYSINFHPVGQYIFAATAHPMLRMYDVRTFRCFTMSEDAHATGISCVRASPDGTMLCTTGFDGTVRIWDALNSRPLATWNAAHGGQLVTSLCWSRDSRNIVSAGRDSTVRLWEVTSGRTLKAYYSAIHQRTRLSASFSFNERHIISTDEKSAEMVMWDVHTGEVSSRFDSTHRNPAVRVVSSREKPALLSFDDEGRFRYWGGRV